MTEKELRAKVCAAAEKYLGAAEADGGHQPIIDLYNSIRSLPRGYRMRYADPWCAAFVSAVGAAAGLSEIILPECSCEAMIGLYQAAGRFEERDEAVPRPGDLIMYDWDDSGTGDCRGTADHVGLVTGVTGNIIHAVEGNMADSVGRRSIYIDSRCIRGYCKPDYASLADGAAAPPAPKPAQSAGSGAGEAVSCGVSLPQLQKGMSGECVRAAQLLLIGRGFRVGPWGADGDFGAATFGGVLRYQRGRKLEADGVIGPVTWRSLLGL